MLFADEELRHEVLPKLQAEDYEDLPTAPIFRALRELEQGRLDVDFDILSQKTEGETSRLTTFADAVNERVSLHASNEHYAAGRMRPHVSIDESTAED